MEQVHAAMGRSPTTDENGHVVLFKLYLETIMAVSSGRKFRTFWGSVCFAIAIAIPFFKIVIRDQSLDWLTFLMIIVLFVAGLSMIDPTILVTVSRAVRPFVPGASKNISGDTLQLPPEFGEKLKAMGEKAERKRKSKSRDLTENE